MKKGVYKMSGPVCCYQCATTIEKEVTAPHGNENAEMEYKKGLMTVEYDEKVVKSGDTKESRRGPETFRDPAMT